MNTTNRLCRARELAGLSLAQAARLLDIPCWMLERAEAGLRDPVSHELRKMADVYGCSVSWLRGAEPQMPDETRKMLRESEIGFSERDDLLELIGSMERRR